MKLKHLFSICIFFSLFTIQSFAQTADVTEGCVPLSVSFTPPSGSTTYFWEFGDGGTSMVGSAGNIYTTPGNYTVVFRESENGPQVGNSFVISVYSEPQLDVVATPTTGCSPLDVLFTPTLTLDPALTLNGLNWVYGDGSSDFENNSNPVSHTYTQAGDFSLGVDLTTNVPNCNVTFPFSNIVSVSGPSGVSFTTDPNPPITCVGPLTVTFVNTTPGAGNFTFAWDFGNGNTSTDINPPAQTYTNDGVYTVTLSATDGNGCETQFSQDVRVGPPNVDFSPAVDTACINSIVQMFNFSEAGTYNWTFGNGAFPASSTQDQPLVQFSQGGLIEITLTVTANGCSNTLTKSIFIDEVDTGFTVVPSFGCNKTLTSVFTATSPKAIEFSWLFSDGTTSDQQTVTHTVVNPDTTIYSYNGLIIDTTFLTVTNLSGCSAIVEVYDTIWQPNALFAPDVANGCAPLEVTFEEQAAPIATIVQWDWDFGDGSPVETYTTSTDPVHIYNNAGEYDVQLIVTNAQGCKDTSYLLPIEVGTTLMPDFTVDKTEICPGDTVLLTPISFPGDDQVDAWHFDTDDSRSFHCFQQENLEWAFVTETGDFDVTLWVEYNGCISSITKSDLVTVKGPIADIDYLIDCENPYTVSFTNNSQDETIVTWDFGDGSPLSNVPNLMHTYADTGAYTVYLTAENPSTGCAPSVDSVVINIADIHAEFVLLDTLLCLGNLYLLDAAPSRNVDNRCWRGYTWHFSDPNDRPITSPTTTVEHFFEMPGVNNVQLITRDMNGCLDTFDQTVTVYGVYPAYNVDDDTICIGQLVNFLDLSTADTLLSTWAWDFGDGGTSDEENPGHVFTSSADPNFATVTLTLTDTLGCSGMLSTDIPVYTPISQLTALPDPAICLGDVIDFSAGNFTSQGSFLNYEWNFGNGTTSMNQMETIEYLAEGDYTVTLNYTEDATGCRGPEQTIEVSVQDYPDADFSTSVDGQTVVCYPETVEFTNNSTSNNPLDIVWDFGNGSPPLPGNQNPAITFDKGTFEIALAVTTSNGCVDTTRQTITLEGPEGEISVNPGAICSGEEITFTIFNLVDVSSWEWDFPNGTVSSGGETQVYTYDMPPPASGVDTIKVLLQGAGSACEFTLEQPFNVSTATADLSSIEPVYCIGEEVFLSTPATGSNTVLWDLGNGVTSNEPTFTYVYPAGGRYTISLTVTDQLVDCTDMNSIDIAVIDSLNVVPSGGIVCPGEAVVLGITGVKDFHNLVWGGGPVENLSCLECDNPIATFNESATYTLTVSDEFGECPTNSYSFKYTVPTGAFRTPNAFTPDGDNENDVFNLVPTGGDLDQITVTRFEVFNRWGQKVYDNDTPGTGWDGTQNGKPAASDVYLFNIEIEIDGCDADSYRGNVTLIR